MKLRFGILVLSIALFSLSLSACRTNLLPEYLPKVESTHVITYANTYPVVNIGESRQEGAVGQLAGAASFGLTIELQQRLQKVVDVEGVATLVSDSFTQELTPSFGFSYEDEPQDADTRIVIDIEAFGFEASSIESPLYYFVEADVSMVYNPENKLIWEYSTTLRQPINENHFFGGAVGSATNIGAVAGLTDDEIVEVFNDLATYAGAELVHQMRADSASN